MAKSRCRHATQIPKLHLDSTPLLQSIPEYSPCFLAKAQCILPSSCLQGPAVVDPTVQLGRLPVQSSRTCQHLSVPSLCSIPLLLCLLSATGHQLLPLAYLLCCKEASALSRNRLHFNLQPNHVLTIEEQNQTDCGCEQKHCKNGHTCCFGRPCFTAHC